MTPMTKFDLFIAIPAGVIVGLLFMVLIGAIL
jgi:hypothetical protein